MPYATNSGVRIHYEVVGSGVPLVVHTRFASSLADWYRPGYVDALTGQCTLVLIDPRGQGASDKPHETELYTSAHRVADVLAVLDALGVAHAHFLGYSMGGRVGFDLGAQAPQRFFALIIGGAHPFGSEPNVAWAELLGQGMETFLTEGVERAMGQVPADVRARWLANDAVALAAATRTSRPSLEADVGSMDLPILIYCGDQDPVYEPAKRAAALLPRATFAPSQGSIIWRAFSTAQPSCRTSPTSCNGLVKEPALRQRHRRGASPRAFPAAQVRYP